MYEITKARMLLTTAALAAFAALFAGGANARLMDVDGGTATGAATVPSEQPPTIPYLSHGIGVDESLWSGTARSTLTGVHAALERDRSESSATVQGGWPSDIVAVVVGTVVYVAIVLLFHPIVIGVPVIHG